MFLVLIMTSFEFEFLIFRPENHLFFAPDFYGAQYTQTHTPKPTRSIIPFLCFLLQLLD